MFFLLAGGLRALAVRRNTVETVALYPASPENEIDAEAAGLAILRALEIVERG